MKTPNIHNLRKRAKVLGLVITKIHGPEDTGESGFVLHRQGANIDDMSILSLYGVARKIEARESENVKVSKYLDSIAARPLESFGTPARRCTKIVEALEVIDDAKIIGAAQTIDGEFLQFYPTQETQIKEGTARRLGDMVGREISKAFEPQETKTVPRFSHQPLNVEMRMDLAVMKRSDFNKLVELLRELHRLG